MSDDVLLFAPEPPRADAPMASARPPWHVLVVDDDPDVFAATRFALDGYRLFERPLQLEYAASAAAARERLARGDDVALVLLDVVMETPTAGLELITHIREQLHLRALRIVLRTGQPGYAPEQDTILRFDINDYRTKDELTQQRLLTAVTTSLRSYQQIHDDDERRRGLELIARASAELGQSRSPRAFAEALIPPVNALLRLPPAGLVLSVPGAGQPPAVLAGAGPWGALSGQSLQALAGPGSAELPGLPAVLEAVVAAMGQSACWTGAQAMACWLGGHEGSALVLGLPLAAPLDDGQRALFGVMRQNLLATYRSVGLVDRLHHQAYVDPLLGLPNRTRFIELIDDALGSADPADWTVALVDVDDFAAVNDLMGHAYGDALLLAFACRLQDHFGQPVQMARMNSNTFGLLGAAGRLDPARVTAAFTRPLRVAGQEQVVSVTSGFARLQGGVQAGADWLKDVGTALKHAKRHFRGRHAEFTPHLGQEARGRAQLLASLHTAFAQQQLFLVYQPQVALADAQVLGLEALVRWRTEGGQMVPPDRFIPVAEQSGLILPLGDWVMHTACAAMRELVDLGLAPLRMAVNVSVLQFQQTDFVDRVAAALQRHRLQAAQLELELTESVAVMGAQAVAGKLAALRALGVSVAIDDFGTGYSSLSYLGQLPVDCLKIDRSFTVQLGSGHDPRIVELISQIGQSMKLRVLAEGVETEAMAESLRAAGCQEAQGYLYARPMEAKDLHAWLARQRG